MRLNWVNSRVYESVGRKPGDEKQTWAGVTSRWHVPVGRYVDAEGSHTILQNFIVQHNPQS